MEPNVKIKGFVALIVFLIVGCILANGISAAADTIVTKEYWVLNDGYSGDFTNSGKMTVSSGPYGNYIAKPHTFWHGISHYLNPYFRVTFFL